MGSAGLMAIQATQWRVRHSSRVRQDLLREGRVSSELRSIYMAGAAILYDTSRALTSFRDDACVGASPERFASVALMFW